MKTLGGVGAVVLGGMLLLTVKIGPAQSPQDPSRPVKIEPGTAVAAVPDAPPRSTPAAVAPGYKVVNPSLVKPAKSEPPDPAPAFDWSWAVSLPASVVCL